MKPAVRLAIILFTTAFFSSILPSISLADFPVRAVFDCQLFGADLESVSATASMQVRETQFPNGPATSLQLKYSSDWDKVVDAESIVPAIATEKKARGVHSLKVSYLLTLERDRYTRLDNYFLVIDLSRQVLAVVNGKKTKGFAAKAGFNTGRRYLEADGLCVTSVR